MTAVASGGVGVVDRRAKSSTQGTGSAAALLSLTALESRPFAGGHAYRDHLRLRWFAGGSSRLPVGDHALVDRFGAGGAVTFSGPDVFEGVAGCVAFPVAVLGGQSGA